MGVFSHCLTRHLFLGSATAAGSLLPFLTTLNPVNELDDVSPGGYRWTQVMPVVPMTLPRTLVELSPFIVLLRGTVGLGQLSKSSELIAICSTGPFIFRIALMVLAAGTLRTISLDATDEWMASSLQQQALQIKPTATALGEDNDTTGDILWARRGNEPVTVKLPNKQGQSVGVEISHYRDGLSLESYIYTHGVITKDGKTWILHGVNYEKWLNGKETLEILDNPAWQSASTSINLEELLMPGNTFSVRQFNHYTHYSQNTGQPSSEYHLVLWEKLGQPILTLAMILLVVPFTFSVPRLSGMDNRLTVGVIVGLLTWISYQIMVNPGLLFVLSAPVTVSGLPIAPVLVALSLVY